jgi:hypothetical protein
VRTKDFIPLYGEKNFEELVVPQMKELFPDTSFYLPSVDPVQPQYWNIIAVCKGQIYYMLPEDFNGLLAEAGVQVTDANRASIARAIIWLAHEGFSTDLIRFEQAALLDEADLQLPQYRYQLEIRSWSRERGLLVNWRFGFKGNRVEIVLYTILGTLTRGYHIEQDLNPPLFGLSRGRADSGYYICCNGGEKLMTSVRGITLAPEAEASTDCSIDGGGKLSRRTASEAGVYGLIEKARQAYPGYPIDARSLFIGVCDDSMNKLSSFSFPNSTFTLISPSVEELWSAPLSYAGILAVEGEKTWRLPEEFSLLLEDRDIQVTDANRADAARAFAWAAHRELAAGNICYTEAHVIDEVDPQFPLYRYQLAFRSRSSERGVLVDWKFGFQAGRIAVVRAAVLGRFTGRWFSLLHPYVLDPFFEGQVTYYVCDEEGRLR